MKYATWLRLALTVIFVLSMLSACSGNFLLTSAQESTGGNGAGVSEMQ